MSTWARGSGIVWCAGILLAAVLLYVGNLLATLARAPSLTLPGAHVVAALVFLAVAASIGFALAWNLHAGFIEGDHLRWLRSHAHAAGLGFFGLLTMGVAYRLFEMFLLSHGAPMRWGKVGLVATVTAVVGIVLNPLVANARLAMVGAGVPAAVGIGAFFLQVRAIHARRLRRQTDIAWRHSVASLAYLGAAAAVGLALAWGVAPGWQRRLELAYGLLAIPGFIGSIVLGQLCKIVPFLVWYHRLSPYVGLKKVPAASELLAQGPQRAHWALTHAGLGMLLAGLLADSAALRFAGAAAFAASAALFARNMIVIYRSEP
jgi:hypothetical protein